MVRRIPLRKGIATNTAAVRENFVVTVPDGQTTFFSFALSNATFNRSIAVAENFQEFRVKYCKMTFKPACDTYAYPGNGPIPNLYFQYNKTNSILTTSTLQTLLDMGVRPVRFDDKNIVRAWKPTVLLGADQAPPATQMEASSVKTTPWLSTNLFAQNPGSAWSPSDVQHLGAVFFVTRPNPATVTNYTVDVEVVFQFRKPLSLAVPAGAYSYTQVLGGSVNQIDVSGNSV